MFRRVTFFHCFILFFFIALSAKAESQPEELLTAASQAFHNGFSDITIRYCEDFLQQHPSHPKTSEIKFLLGQSYFLKNQFSEALNVFISLSDESENQDGVNFWVGECYLKLKQTDRAKEQYEKVIKDFDKSTYATSAMYSLGWLYLEEQRYKTAKEIFERLSKNYPNNPLAEDAWLKASEAALSDQDWQGAVDLLKRYLSTYPQSVHQDEVYFNLAESFYNLESYAQAFDAYQKTVQATKQSSIKLSAFIGQIWSLGKLGRINDIAAIVKSAKSFAFDNQLATDELLIALGSVYFEAGDYQQSLASYEQFIKENPGSSQLNEAYLGRANVHFAMKNFDEAALDYRRLLDVSDREISQKAHFGLGWLLIKQGQSTEAFPFFKSVVDKSLDPVMKSNALLQMADAYQDASQMALAIDQYQQLLLDYSELANKDYVKYRLGIAYLKSDQIQEAIKLFNEIEKEFPSTIYLSDIKYYQGVAAFKQGNWDVSAKSMESFLKNLTKPSDFTPQANYILGIAQLNLKQIDEALKTFQKILRLYPDNLVVAKNADVGIARCFVESGQWKEAEKRFKLIVFKYPKMDAAFEALIWLGKNELKNNNSSQAIDYYQKAVDDFSDQPGIESAYYELAQAYELSGETDKALDYYYKVSKDRTVTPKARMAMADLLAKDVSVNQAIAILIDVIKVYPDLARDASLRLGQLYRNSQQYEKEVQVYGSALKMNQGKSLVTDAQLLFSLADTFEMMSKMEEAIEQYLAIGQKKDSDTSWSIKAYLRVAKIYEDNRDWQAARLTYQRIVTFNTDESKYAQERLDWIKQNISHRR